MINRMNNYSSCNMLINCFANVIEENCHDRHEKFIGK